MLPSDFNPEREMRQRYLRSERAKRGFMVEAASRLQVMSNEGLWNLNFQMEREDLAPGGFFSRIAAEFSRRGWKFERAMLSVAVEVPAKSKGEAFKMLNKELVRQS